MATYTVPPQGSLGLLALGHHGVEAWRAARDAAAETATPPASAATDDSPPVVIVSGLPRSGTSMVMQMLEAGGLEPFTDGVREADASNPRGYSEHEGVKALARSNDWVAEAAGKTLKVVTPLVPYLPRALSYCIVEIVRDLDEVLASQATMLARRGDPPGDEASLRDAYSRFRRLASTWADSTSGVATLSLSHRDVVSEPEAAASQIADFLAPFGFQLSAEAMAAVVDPSLYRERSDG